MKQSAKETHAQAAEGERDEAQRIADAARVLVDSDPKIEINIEEHNEAESVCEDVSGLVVQVEPRLHTFEPAGLNVTSWRSMYEHV